MHDRITTDDRYIKMSKAMTRREVLTYAGAGFAGAIADHALGELAEAELSSEPKTDVISFNCAAGRTVLVAGGIVNNGEILGRMMQPALGDIGTVMAVSYAETNVDPDKLTKSVEQAINTHELGDGQFDLYLNSAAGIFMAPTVNKLAREGLKIGSIVLDSAPYNANDVKGPLGFLIRIGAYRFGYSRVLNRIVRFGSNLIQDPAADKDPDVPLVLSEAYRSTQVNADTITYMNQAAAIRRGAPRDVLKGVGRRIIFAHSLNDPLIKSASSFRNWKDNSGGGVCEDVVLPQRLANTHGAIATHPNLMREILLHQPLE